MLIPMHMEKNNIFSISCGQKLPKNSQYSLVFGKKKFLQALQTKEISLYLFLSLTFSSIFSQ